jgi:hypothetical protein
MSSDATAREAALGDSASDLGRHAPLLEEVRHLRPLAAQFPLDMTLSPAPRMGWATATFREGADEIHLGLSYLTDAFGDVARAAARIVEGQAQAWVCWEDEPGEHRLYFSRWEPNASWPQGVVQIELWTDTYCLNDGPLIEEEGGHRRAWVDVTIPVFQAGMIALLERLLAENGGAEAFAARWFGHVGDSTEVDGEFPLAALDRLRAVPAAALFSTVGAGA